LTDPPPGIPDDRQSVVDVERFRQGDRRRVLIDGKDLSTDADLTTAARG
jgi:hypothetical protein